MIIPQAYAIFMGSLILVVMALSYIDVIKQKRREHENQLDEQN